MSLLQKKETTTSFNLSKLNVLGKLLEFCYKKKFTLIGTTSKILKITNLIDPERFKTIEITELDEVLEDISEEFGKGGKIVDSFIVKKEKTIAGGKKFESLRIIIEYS